MNDLTKRAEKVYNDNFDNSTWFERAIFISWFCAKPTCKFCYMYTIKDNIKDPSKARRRISSILAESLICKLMNWKIGFISSGIFAFGTEEIKNILEKNNGKDIYINGHTQIRAGVTRPKIIIF